MSRLDSKALYWTLKRYKNICCTDNEVASWLYDLVQRLIHQDYTTSASISEQSWCGGLLYRVEDGCIFIFIPMSALCGQIPNS